MSAIYEIARLMIGLEVLVLNFFLLVGFLLFSRILRKTLVQTICSLVFGQIVWV